MFTQEHTNSVEVHSNTVDQDTESVVINGILFINSERVAQRLDDHRREGYEEGHRDGSIVADDVEDVESIR